VSDSDIILLALAYNALIDCVYAPDAYAKRKAMRVLKALGERLEITPDEEVTESLKELAE